MATVGFKGLTCSNFTFLILLQYCVAGIVMCVLMTGQFCRAPFWDLFEAEQIMGRQ